MALDSVDRSGRDLSAAGRPERSDAPQGTRPHHPVAQQRMKEIRTDAIEGADAVDVRSIEEARTTYRAHQERLQRAIEGRRKLLDAVREMLLAGGLESEDAALRAADGLLRRGAVA